MQKLCLECQSPFEVTDKDLDFYKKLDLPSPTICPICRQRLRASFRNERNLYSRQCDLCKKTIISIHHPNKKFPVYCQTCYWGDKWDAKKFSLEIDTSKSFFEQFKRLTEIVPRLAIINKQSENSEYCNYSFANKNCYLTFGNHHEEDCIYGHYSTKNLKCIDYLHLYKSELCYQCTFSKICYHSIYLDHCENCIDCLFSRDLKGCEHCFLCANLRHKKYHILNKEFTKEKYFEELKKYKLNTYKGFSKTENYYLTTFKTKVPSKAIYQVNCQDCYGNNLENSKNLKYCFDCAACEDCSYGFQMDETYDSMDMTCMGYDRSEVCFQTIGCQGLFDCMACDSCWHNSELKYCNLCFSSKDLFGCISLQHSQHCILNKQYEENEYEDLTKKIIETMKKTGEWGQFFPKELSTFGYNETIANERFPTTKEIAIKDGFKWSDFDSPIQNITKTVEAKQIPDTNDRINDEILNWAIKCGKSGKLFKLTPQEFKFYKDNDIPIPRIHPEIRHKERIEKSNPQALWDSVCSKCGEPVKAPCKRDSEFQIYCEKCYLKTFY